MTCIHCGKEIESRRYIGTWQDVTYWSLAGGGNDFSDQNCDASNEGDHEPEPEDAP